METLKLENPIFIIHYNINSLTRQRAEEQIRQLHDEFNRYNNATFWVMPQQEGKNEIELIWKGTNYSHILDSDEEESYKKSFVNLHKRFAKILELIADGVSDVTLKQKLRDFTLNDILNEGNY
jgi:hypothetical protein